MVGRKTSVRNVDLVFQGRKAKLKGSRGWVSIVGKNKQAASRLSGRRKTVKAKVRFYENARTQAGNEARPELIEFLQDDLFDL